MSLLLKWSLPVGHYTGASESDALHPALAVNLVVQLINAAIQHSNRPVGYFIYLIILHGPVVLGMSVVHQVAQYYTLTRLLGVAQPLSSPSIVYLTGGATIPHTQNLGQERKLAWVGCIVYLVQGLIFTGLYAICDRAEFDASFTNGVDWDELDSMTGILANVFAQAVWLCALLVGTHLVASAYPSSASLLVASYFVGTADERWRLVVDAWGSLTAAALTMVGVSETLVDDDTGIGPFMLCIYPSLLASSLFRILTQRDWTPANNHPIWSRPCYRQQTTDDGATMEPDSSSMAPGTTTTIETTTSSQVATPSSPIQEKETEIV